MKTLISLFAISMLILGSCTKTEYEEIIKYIDRPGPMQFIPVTTEKECESTDTTSIKIVIEDVFKNGEFTKDTLLNVETTCSLLIKISGYTLVPRDSVVTEKIVYQDRIVYKDRIVTVYDTIREIRYDRSVVYLDTLYVIGSIRPVYSVPDELQGHVTDFYTLAGQYNKSFPGGVILIVYVHPEDLPGEGWVSESFWIGGYPYGQMYIGVSESLPPELHRASILREMARLQLRKKYVTDVNKIMSPLFPPEAVITTNHLNQLFQ